MKVPFNDVSIFFNLLLLLLLINVSLIRCEWKPVYQFPEQIHLSLGSSYNKFVVTWITLNRTYGTPTVWYGKDKLDKSVEGSRSSFQDEGKLKLIRYVYRVTLSDLNPNTKYFYKVGSNDSWSNVLRFKTFPQNDEWNPRILIFGDLGNDNDRTISMLQKEIQDETVDFTIHLGDFAYNLEHSNGYVGDAFFREIEPMASYRPYQVLVGNHEDFANFTAYDNRFSMYSQDSSEKNNFFWSYNFGKAHFIFFSTEFHYTPWYGTEQIRTQYRWLEEDLKKAHANRPNVPWIITCGHRPLYDNFYINNKLRVGTKELPGFEELFHRYGVDLEFWAHDHIFERMWPVYNKKVQNGSLAEPYKNPNAPVHIISGSAGCSLKPDALNPDPPYYSAFLSRDYTYSILTINGAKSLKLQTKSQNQNKTIDTMILQKDSHGPYTT